MGEIMELLYGTTNEGKLLVMRRALAPLGIEVRGLKDMGRETPSPPEIGTTPLENARIKARVYYQEYRVPVFSCDTGLYFEPTAEKYQPGIYVRRPLGYEMTDEELTEYYRGLAEKLGSFRAWYQNAVCFYKSDREIYESEEPKLSGKPFFITDKPHPKRQPGFPLDRISIEISSGKYYYDLPANAQDEVALDE